MLSEILGEFRRYRQMADKALADLTDDSFFNRPGTDVNPIALIVKHVGGNLRSRWTDFLTTDGEKPDRNRDGEFQVGANESRDAIMQRWQAGWQAVETTFGSLSEEDLTLSISIRGESLSVCEACLRSVTHTAYHVGQILYLARMLQPEREWLTIPPGQSSTFSRPYLDRASTPTKDQP